MPDVKIRETRIEDIAVLAGCLRKEDRMEVLAQGYASAGEALQKSFEASKYRFTIDLKGKPVAMFGLIEVAPEQANVWFLGAPGLSKMKKFFLSMSKEVVREMLVEYPILWAQVDSRYEKTHGWLTWLGAKNAASRSINGVNFHHFVFSRQEE